MLKEILDNLKKTVPDAFLSEGLSIPWVNKEAKTVSLREVLEFREFPIFPPIFLDPEAEIPEADEEIEDRVRENGIEALAWYVPFHRSSKWGIYFRVRGICYLSNYFKTKSNITDVNERVKIALEVLFYHEFFHFLTEITTANMEMMYKKQLYNSYFEFLKKNPELRDEESLANAYVLRRVQKRYHSYIKRFFNIQPPPYSQFQKFMRDTDFLAGKRRLGAIIRMHSVSEIISNVLLSSFPDIDEPFWEFLFNVEPEKLFLPDIPIYFILEKDHPTYRIKFITPVFKGVKLAAYPCDHPPPHLHIWIPADSKRDGRYLYPSLEPYMGARPLSRKQRKKVQMLIDKYKDKIEDVLVRTGLKI